MTAPKHRTFVLCGDDTVVFYQAHCKCGWEGQKEAEYYDAKDNGTDHTITVAHREKVS